MHAEQALAILRVVSGKAAEAEAPWITGTAILREVNDPAELVRKRTDMRAACRQAGVPIIAGAEEGLPAPP